MYDRESIVMKSNFRNEDLDGFKCFEVSKSENNILSDWSACVFVISKISKQIIFETPNFVFYFCVTCR